MINPVKFKSLVQNKSFRKLVVPFSYVYQPIQYFRSQETKKILPGAKIF